MKKPAGDELTSWIKDVSNLSGKEILILKREERLFSTRLAEKLLLVTVIIALTFAVSATVFLASPQSLMPTTTTTITITTTTTSTTTTTTTTTTTEPTTTTTESTTTTEPTTTTTTTTEPTTTTTIACGKDLEPPCIYEDGPKCDGGIILGADDLCHKGTHVTPVESGLNDGTGCGSFALG